MLELRPLPVRVRPRTFETPSSYAARLRDTNGIPARAWNAMLRAHERRTGLEPEPAVEDFLIAVGALRPNHFALVRSLLPAHADSSSCVRCVTGLQDRYACALCSRGESVTEFEHDGPRACARHGRWVGPGAGIDEQVPVGLDVLKADRTYHRMKASGALDAHRLAELEECVDAWARAEQNTALDAPTRFTLAVAAWQAVLASGLLKGSAAPSLEARHLTLTRALQRAVNSPAVTVLVDLVWGLLRPTMRVADQDFHAFPAIVAAGSDRSAHGEQYRTSSFPREAHLHRVQFVWSPRAGTRFALQHARHVTHDYECALGHAFPSTVNILANSGQTGGCPYCARRKPLAGFNTLADTHPALLKEWDDQANGDLRPDQVLAGSGIEVHWRCAAKGHHYKATLNDRTTSVIGCGYCSNQLVSADINALSLTHESIARQWHPSLNGSLTPDDVVAGSERPVWWLCEDEGHEWETAPVNRTEKGSGCHYCTRQKAHPTTCFAVTHPEAAATWHEEMNAGLTPYDVLAGSTQKAWFTCPEGHAYDQAISSRVKGVGCKYCSNYEAADSNCMATVRPDLAAQFHPTKNGSLTPESVVPGTSRKLWWQCALKHEWDTTGDNRVRSNTGCPYCSNKKVWAGFNDLASTHPNLASQFHDSRNAPLRATDIVAGTAKRLWWQCECGEEWPATGDSRVNKGRGCPGCKRCVTG